MKDNKKVPLHVSIIMDGNGRWAKERGKERVFGHYEGVGSVRACTEAAAEAGVKYLSLFAFSEENWGRPEEEVNTLMTLMVKSMRNEIEPLIKNNVRFMVLGHRERLGDDLNKMIDECMNMSAHCTGLTLVIMLSYSGKWDILQSIGKMAAEVAADPQKAEAFASNPEAALEGLESHLVTRAAGIPDPDLIIRTSGECRISNYFLWQAAYSELVFTDVLWPDFRKPEFRSALDEYANRDRRYGKVK